MPSAGMLVFPDVIFMNRSRAVQVWVIQFRLWASDLYRFNKYSLPFTAADTEKHILYTQIHLP